MALRRRAARVPIKATAAGGAETPPPAFPAFRFTLWAVTLVTAIRVMWLAGRPIDLYPDEAQYWIWAQTLDWGYFSKPPMVAWLIALTTRLFGETDLAVKIASPILYLATSLVVFQIAARLYDRRVAAWAGFAFATLPAVSLSSLIISTDVPLLFCWALATLGFVRAREPGGGRWWLLVGLAGGIGLLSKYAMGFWLGSALGFLVLVPDERRHLKRFAPALLLAFLLYLPNLLWNAQHHFASYRHTEANANIHGLSLHPASLALFAGAQAAVFGPVFLGSILIILAGGRRVIQDRRTLLLLTFAVPTLAIMLTVSLLSRAQPNWSAPAYVSLTVLAVGWLVGRGRDGWVQWSVVGHIVAAVLVLGAADIAQAIGHPLPGAWDPLHRVRGWARLGRSADALVREHGEWPLLGDQRELMAGLIYYMHPHPTEMLIWNPGGGARNGFEMNQSLPPTPGGDYLWLTDRPDLKGVLSSFESHEQLGHVLVPIGPGLMRQLWAYGLHGFKGYPPPEPAEADPGDPGS